MFPTKAMRPHGRIAFFTPIERRSLDHFALTPGIPGGLYLDLWTGCLVFVGLAPSSVRGSLRESFRKIGMRSHHNVPRMENTMPIICPLCHSDRIQTRSTDQEVTGAFASVSRAAISGLSATSRVDANASNPFRTISILISALFSSRNGASIGGTAGANTVHATDKAVLQLNCQDCGFSFCEQDPQANHPPQENT